MMQPIDRRSFIETTCLGASAALLSTGGRFIHAAETSSAISPPAALNRKYRAAAIGSTGHGDFGHGMDLALVDLPGVEFVAIADDNPQGLEAAGKRCGIDRLYGDYRKMLDELKPDLVTIGMRQSETHEDVVVHCATAGKHIYCEKPIATDLASLDRMMAACNNGRVKLAAAVPNRVSPAIQHALRLVRDGAIGKLRAVHAQGKCDNRGGGEDLMVLGYHNLDLMCLFAGQPQWTFAQVLEGGRDATKSDARPATEPIGPIAGDCVVAMFGFPEQVHGHFQSHRIEKVSGDRFNFEIHGTEGIITARSLADVVRFRGASFNPAKPHQWKPIAVPEFDALPNKYHWCHQRLVLDLLAAAEADREPLAGINHVRWAQEMIQSVYASHLAQSRVALPLPEGQRSHPLN